MSNIIKIGSLNVSRKSAKHCDHIHLNYDQHNKTIWCSDCGGFVDPFNAFMILANQFERANVNLDRKRKEVNEATEKGLTLLAARKVEKAWRRRDMVPACPHCEAGILPTDGLGDSMVNKKMDSERKAFKKRNKDGGNV
jgi:hypothetical protein